MIPSITANCLECDAFLWTATAPENPDLWEQWVALRQSEADLGHTTQCGCGCRMVLVSVPISEHFPAGVRIDLVS